jgi:hypothetical protein
MDCSGCHTDGALIGQPDPALHLAGSGIGFEVAGLRILYLPNLTPDRETGLGALERVRHRYRVAHGGVRTAGSSPRACPGAPTRR